MMSSLSSFDEKRPSEFTIPMHEAMWPLSSAISLSPRADVPEVSSSGSHSLRQASKACRSVRSPSLMLECAENPPPTLAFAHALPVLSVSQPPLLFCFPQAF